MALSSSSEDMPVSIQDRTADVAVHAVEELGDVLFPRRARFCAGVGLVGALVLTDLLETRLGTDPLEHVVQVVLLHVETGQRNGAAVVDDRLVSSGGEHKTRRRVRISNDVDLLPGVLSDLERASEFFDMRRTDRRVINLHHERPEIIILSRGLDPKN